MNPEDHKIEEMMFFADGYFINYFYFENDSTKIGLNEKDNGVMEGKMGWWKVEKDTLVLEYSFQSKRMLLPYGEKKNGVSNYEVNSTVFKEKEGGQGI